MASELNTALEEEKLSDLKKDLIQKLIELRAQGMS